MVTRRVSVFDPAVITIARIEAGTTDNVIPEDGPALGHHAHPLRADPRHRARGIRTSPTHVAAAHGAEAEVDIDQGFPVTVCDGRVVDLAEADRRTLFGESGWVTMATR